MVREKIVDRKDVVNAAQRATRVLHFTFAAIPIIAGIDKFFYILNDWSNYLAPIFPNSLNVAPDTFMMGVGVIEIIAGIGVALKPRIFARVVGFWMFGIILNLLILGEYYDIALRDFGLGVSAFTLGHLASHVESMRSGSVDVIEERPLKRAA